MDELDAYAFELPPDRIAQQPTPERDGARLLHLDRSTGRTEHLALRALPSLLRAGDLLVVNATRVLPARLRGRKSTGGSAEALLLEPQGHGRYRALVRASGRLREGQKLQFEAAGTAAGASDPLEAELIALGEAGEVTLAFDPAADPYALGEPPLPPYIRRDALEPSDRERYQTVFARVPGAVAAPTAGLHLSERLLAELEQRGVARAEVVLHVGIGTFRPLRQSDLERGTLHRERFELPQATADLIARTRERGGRVVAVGTTSVRVLESCASEAADSAGDARPGLVRARQGETDLFLRPGARFRVVDALLTNFHLPRSSLLMLVAAFAGRESVLAAYAEAVRAGYRFYSYGDAMWIDGAALP